MKTASRIAVAVFALTLQGAAMAAAIPVKLFKNPSCFCCDLYAKHLEQHGFKVELVSTTDMALVKQRHGIPEKLEGCHTALLQGYVVEGLVPAQFVHRLLQERPKIKGLALPGMPVGAPGMEGPKSKPLQVYALEPAPNANPNVFGTF
ncbi:DUF411 domain-containing protein [Piscinibacter koreensis]|uniref:DUF411 domain-containing protein n=1 Tax=Piscinibacter koreensis TaxID=2742824 RepID=A0A7Y6TYU1_9BURK|nr:DUF411 domain-containing protein [Schlegelella koreensis]NUZ08462.1 DUF411 domain-containing protein [Schlegelella koreensis]